MGEVATEKIIILTGHHVCHNPRAFKEAETLSAAGFDVEWLGVWFDANLANRDRLLLQNRKWRFTPVSDWTAPTRAAWWQRQRQRLRRQIGLRLHNLFGLENAWQLGYCAHELLYVARRRKADLFIAHSEPALWAACKLIRLGHRVGVDMEDWFSEDLLPKDRKSRPLNLLRDLERSLLTTAKHRTCTSKAMSRALADAFACNPPLVIYNAFPWADRSQLDGQMKDRTNRKIPSVHWFSQTIGPGRGLEDLFAALPFMESDLEIHLRGNLSSENHQWLDRLMPVGWKTRVFVHPIVHNDELLSRIAEHDIGLALDPNTPPSRNVTITNKILQYLLAGLPVVASDTAGQREIATQAPLSVFLYPNGESKKLAEQLNLVLNDENRLRAAKAAALRAAEEKFSWEKIAPLLVKNVEESFYVD